MVCDVCCAFCVYVCVFEFTCVCFVCGVLCDVVWFYFCVSLFVFVLDCVACCRVLFAMFCAMVCGLKVFVFCFKCV